MKRWLERTGLLLAFIALVVIAFSDAMWLSVLQAGLLMGTSILLIAAAERLQKSREDHLQPQED